VHLHHRTNEGDEEGNYSIILIFEANIIQLSGGFFIPKNTSLSRIPAIVLVYPTSNFRVNCRE